ncbi:tripartite tricarboxylate transporter substrate binding protein [Bradyrhizobium sp. CCBAU 53338]|uniref:Bug family tripartite tricarboxylate transporter substrate binding protein n=1 Tax=Bradyrhizobium sp. CCBAU 53338 TaxID=1325111 RepID=UPI00188D8007|nr:tripartite tricarboxylate transporter substrate binding protein [Bradyrhizobium sp. CCBAU 53338]
MLKRILLAVVLTLTNSLAWAQSFPSRPVTIISPYQAGGTSDIIARTIAQKLRERWSQPILVENRPGANGAIGVQTVARTAPDGHTWLAVASSALTSNPSIFGNLNYDVQRDLAPITRTGQVPNVLVVNPSVPAKTVAELIVFAKANPGKLAYASQGIGSNGHLNGELFAMQTGIRLLHVPYKGSAPAVTDLLGGQVQLMFDNLPTVLPQIQAGTLRALAVTTGTRSSLLPNVPTLAEAGLSKFDTSAWFAVLVARSTAKEIRTQLEETLHAVLTDPEVKAQLTSAGVEPLGQGAADLAEKIEADTAMWRAVIEGARIKME